MGKGYKMKLIIILTLISLALAPFFKGNEVVLSRETPNPVPMYLVETGKRYHGTLAASFRDNRWMFKKSDGEWCKLFKWPEGV